MKNISKILWSVLVVMLSVVNPVAALDTQVGGFGSASLSCFSGETSDYISNNQPRGPGRSSRCDLGLDSLLGVQFDMSLDKTLSLGVQLVANRNADRSYVPGITVAQLRWRLDDQLTLRFGRMPTPAFLHSEDRFVRYAQPWVRPPVEVYGLIPPSSHDGMEFIHTSRWGNWNAEWQGGGAVTTFDSPRANTHDTYPIKSREIYLALSLQDEATLVKFGYGRGTVSIFHPDAEQILAGLRQAGATELADHLAIDDNPSILVAIGMRHKWRKWFAMGEFAHAGTHGYNREQYGAYVTLGYNNGTWTPYATLARRWSRGPESDNRAQVLGLTTQAAVESLLSRSRTDGTSLSVGASMDIDNQATLKLQADRIMPDRRSWGIYTNHAADYNYANPRAEWLFSVNLDFVF